MSLKANIVSWLDQPGADYSEGVDLFRQTGGRGIILRTLQLGEDAYNRTRLEEEFSKWLTTQPGDQPNNVLPIGTAVSSFGFRSAVDSSAVPPLVVSMDYGVSDDVIVLHALTTEGLQHQAWELMNERSELKAQIRAHKDDPSRQPDRKDWAFGILAITDQIDAIYDKLDFQNEYGYLPSDEEPPQEPDETAQLKNVRTYVSRYKSKLRSQKLTPEQRQSYQALLDQYEADKHRLELKLKSKNDSHTSGQQETDRPIHSDPLPPP